MSLEEWNDIGRAVVNLAAESTSIYFPMAWCTVTTQNLK